MVVKTCLLRDYYDPVTLGGSLQLFFLSHFSFSFSPWYFSYACFVLDALEPYLPTGKEKF